MQTFSPGKCQNHELRVQMEGSSAVHHRTAAVLRAKDPGSSSKSNISSAPTLQETKSREPYTQTCKHVNSQMDRSMRLSQVLEACDSLQFLTMEKDMQTAVVWSCLMFTRSGQNHLAFSRHSERGKETRQTEEEVGRQHQRMDRPGVRQVPEGSGEEGKMEETVAKSSVVPQPSRLRD